MIRLNDYPNLTHSLIVALTAILLLFPNTTTAESPEDILIVSNSSIEEDEISIDEIQDLFLKRRLTWSNGDRAVVINAPDGSDLRKDFQDRVLEMTGQEELRYWQVNKIKTGLSAPAEFSNTLKAVYKIKRSISYVYRSQYKEGVAKILLTIPAS